MDILRGSTEEKIINATFILLLNEGLASLTTKKIAEKAQVNEVTLFRKFKSKQNIIDCTKRYYLNYFLNQLDEIFEFDEDIEVEDYLKTTFYKVVNFSDTELTVIKVAMGQISIDNSILSSIADTIIVKLHDFFELQISKNRIKNVNPEVLALNVFSIIFESIILWKIYDKKPNYPIDDYVNDFLDIFINGILIRGVI